jgi:hypothetical protein
MWCIKKYFFQDFSCVGNMLFYIYNEFFITNSLSFLGQNVYDLYVK